MTLKIIDNYDDFRITVLNQDDIRTKRKRKRTQCTQYDTVFKSEIYSSKTLFNKISFFGLPMSSIVDKDPFHSLGIIITR